MYTHTVGGVRYRFADLKTLMARATPARSGDALAGIAAESAEERVAAQMALAELPLSTFLSEAVIPYEEDEVTHLIFDTHDASAFTPVAHLTVGEFRDWLLTHEVTADTLAAVGVNPATDNPNTVVALLRMLDGIRERYAIPTQSCVLAHVTTQLEARRVGAPVDLVFQSVAGTEAANASFGVNLALLREARQAALELGRGTLGNNVMYFETGQGSALSANAHHGVDQQTCEARAYAVARAYAPLLVNSVVGFIGPEYLYDGKEIIRAGLEDHFCGKLLGLPLGVDVCYTNHAEADQDDMDNLLTLLCAAGCTYVMGVPGADDIMLSYQSTSFHDALYVRDLFGLKRAPEFDDWLLRAGLAGHDLRPVADAGRLPEFASQL